MSETIDQKIVEMRFDNAQFEKNVQTSINTTNKLKESLKFENIEKTFDKIGNSVKNIDLDSLGDSVDKLNKRFSALGIVGMTVIQDITRAVEHGISSIVKNLTSIPMKAGLQEYETQIESTQTIMANTGRSVDEVNAALDELNEYADLTIYNFGQMTSNIGKFTAAIGKTPGGLEKATAALKGIGNWAAFAGANATQMATATYQLSQAAANGAIKLQDWNSVINASMGGMNFQEAFKETAREMGIAVDSIIEAEGSFRESLKKGWLTSDVFYETMKKFADDPAMTEAATKVKTFTQMIDVLKEALGTGWAQTWRSVIGNFEEAKDFFTNLTDALQGLIKANADARNAIISVWASGEMDLETLTHGYIHDGVSSIWGGDNGRLDLIKSVENLMNAFASIVGPAKEAWDAIFEPITHNTLKTLTQRLEDFTKGLILNIDQQIRIKKIFVGLFSVLKVGTLVLKNLWTIFSTVITALQPAIEVAVWGVSVIATIAEAISDLIIQMDLVSVVIGYISEAIIYVTGLIGGLFEKILSSDLVFEIIYDAFSLLGGAFGILFDIFDKLEELKGKSLTEILEYIKNIDLSAVLGIDSALAIITKDIDLVKGKFAEFKASVTTFFGPALEILSASIEKVKNVVGSFNIIDLFKKINDNLLKLIPIILLTGGTTGALIYAMRNVLYTFAGFGKLLAKTGRGIERFLTGYAISEIGEAIRNLAISMAILASSMMLISLIPEEGFKRSVYTIAAIGAALLTFSIILLVVNARLEAVKKGVDNVNSWKKALVAGLDELADGIKFFGIAAQIVALGIAILSMVGALKLLAGVFDVYAKMDGETFENGIKKIIKVTAILVGSMAIIAAAAKQSGFFGLAAAILAMVGALALLLKIIESYNNLNQDIFENGFNNLSVVLWSFAGSLALIGLAVKRSAAGLLALIPVMGAVLVSMLGFFAEIMILGDPSYADKVINGINNFEILLWSLTGAMSAISLILGFATDLANADIVKGGKNRSIAGPLVAFGGALIEIALGMDAMLPALIVLGHMNVDDLKQGIFSIIAIIASLGVASSLMAKTDWKALLAFGGIIFSFVMTISTIVGLLAIGQLQNVLIATGIIAGLMLAMGGMMKTARKFKAQAPALLAMIGMLLMVTHSIKDLANMDPEDLFKTVAAVCAIFVSLGILFKMAGDLTSNRGKKNKNGNNAWLGIIAMFAGLSSLLVIISNASSENLNQITVWSLIGVLAAIEALTVGMVKILDLTGKIKQPKSKLLILATMFAGLSGLTLAIGKAAKDSPSTKAILAIGAVLMAVQGMMDGMLVIMSMSKQADKANSAVLVITFCISALGALIGGLCQLDNIDKALKVAASIGLLAGALGVMTAISAILGEFVKSAGSVMKGALIIVGVAAILTMGVLGITGIVWALDDLFGVMDNLKDMATKFGEVIGGFAGGMTKAAKELDPEVGSGLTNFVKAAKGFFDGIKDVDSDAVDGAKSMANALIAIGGARLINSLANLAGFFTGGNSLKLIGKQLSEFVPFFVDFANQIAGTNVSKVKRSGEAIQALFTAFAAAPNSGGLLALIVGDNTATDIKNFGDNLWSLGTHLADYGSAISAVTNWDTIETSAETLRRLFKALKDAPNQGGFIALLSGDNAALTVIGENLAYLGYYLSLYGYWISGITNMENIKKSGGTLSALFNGLKAAPNSGGLLGLIVGENDALTIIGTNLAYLGYYLNLYGYWISGITNWDTINDSAAIIKNLFTALKSAPNINYNMFGGLTTKNQISMAGEQLVKLAGYLVSFTEKIKEANVKDWSFLDPVAEGTMKLMKLLHVINLKSELQALPKEKDLSKMSDLLAELAKLINRFARKLLGRNIDYDAVVYALGRTESIFDLVGNLNLNGADSNNIVHISENMLTVADNIRMFYKKLDSVGTDSIEHTKELILQYKKLTSMDLDVDKATAVSTSTPKTGGGHKTGQEDQMIFSANKVIGASDTLRKIYNKETSKTVKALYKDAEKVTDTIEDGNEEVEETAKKTGGILNKIFGKDKADSFKKKGSGIFGNVADKLGISDENKEKFTSFFSNLDATLGSDYGQYFDLLNTDTVIEKVEGMFDGILDTMGTGGEEVEDKTKEIIENVDKIFEDYHSTFSNKRDSFMNEGGLFSAVNWGFDPENPVTKETLKKNLEDQIAQLSRFTNVQAELAARISNAGLRYAIQEMGVDSLEELEALSTMTDDELAAYEKLYESKFDLAYKAADTVGQKARDTLAGSLNAELGTSFGNLDSNEAVHELESFWDGTEAGLKSLIQADAAGIGHGLMSGIAEGMSDEESKAVIETLGKGVSEAIANGMTMDEAIQTLKDAGYALSENVEKSLRETVENSEADAMKEALGKGVAEGMAQGMTCDEAIQTLKDAGYTISDDIETYLREALDINSPSKRIRDNVGAYVNEAIIPTDDEAAENIRNAVTMVTAWIVNQFREKVDIYRGVGEFINNAIIEGMTTNTTSAVSNMETIADAATDALSKKTVSPTITPVYNSSSLDMYNKSMANSLMGQRSLMLANQANASMSTEINKTIKVDNGNVIAAINRLDTDLLAVGERVNGLQVRLDSGALVGQIAPQMNSALGMTALRTGRYGG